MQFEVVIQLLFYFPRKFEFVVYFLSMIQWKTIKLKRLAHALLSLKTEREMLAFLRDAATLEELDELGTRWDVVLELNKGKSYRDIAKKTGVSTATVTRIAHWFRHGEGGYQAALKKIKQG